jgi:hypothetical protein
MSFGTPQSPFSFGLSQFSRRVRADLFSPPKERDRAPLGAREEKDRADLFSLRKDRPSCTDRPPAPTRAMVFGSAGTHACAVLFSALNDHTGALMVVPRVTGKSCKISSYAKCATKPFRIRTYKNSGPQAVWNQHLQKNKGGGGQTIVTQIPTANSRIALSG